MLWLTEPHPVPKYHFQPLIEFEGMGKCKGSQTTWQLDMWELATCTWAGAGNMHVGRSWQHACGLELATCMWAGAGNMHVGRSWQHACGPELATCMAVACDIFEHACSRGVASYHQIIAKGGGGGVPLSVPLCNPGG